MIVEVKRIFKSSDYTIGKMFIDGECVAHTLEDAERPEKIPDVTAIPQGEYQVIINYSQRFKRQMPLLVNVPNFEGVRIHAGNTAANTSGCILVGRNTEKGRLTQSRESFDVVFAALSEAYQAGEKILIRIT